MVHIEKHSSIIGDLETSWFNLWHMHVDVELGHQSLEKRFAEIERLICAFNSFESRLSARDTPYQLFVIVHESSGHDDAVFIHTPNPQEDNFPYVFQQDSSLKFQSSEIDLFLEKHPEFARFLCKHDGKLFYILYKQGIGVPVII